MSMNKIRKLRERLQQRFEAAKGKIELQAAPPTYPADASMAADEARQKLDQVIDDFIRAAAAWNAEHASDDDDGDNPFIEFANSEYASGLEEPPPVHAMRVSTGVGKTQRFAARLANHIRTTADAGAWLYLAPTHRLNEDTAKHFRSHGLSAKVYRGRDAPDPNIPGNMARPKPEQERMCLEREKVALAQACRQSIDKACCTSKHEQCASYDKCGYQRQLRGDQPNAWLAAHNMLFHPQKHFGDIAGVVIDETFYKHGIYGVELRRKEEEHDRFTLDDMAGEHENITALDCHSYWRDDLIQILREHPLGGLERARFIDKIQPEDCSCSIKEEWKIFDKIKFSPQMTSDELAKIKEQLPVILRARWMAGVWRTLRDLLQQEEVAVSGRLVLEKNKAGKIGLRHRGVREIVEARKVPTAILDATLPDVSVLRTWYPQVDVVANIEVEMPHVHIRQVIAAPVSQRKLWGTEKKPAVGEHNLKAIRRYVLQRWLESERQTMLVVCQQDAEKWLKQAGLPDGIAVEHFNNISGLDRYKDVYSLILVGRTIPSPVQVEAYAGALTGIEPIKTAATGNWYNRVSRGIRLANGSGIGVECDEHPDPVAEAIRLQICEAELVQALGRARGVNRKPDTPLTVDILADVVLPIPVNEVVLWTEPSAAVEMAVEGIVLAAPKDMAKAWPGIWETARAAKCVLEKIKALVPGARGNKDVFPIEYYTIGKTSLLGFLYRSATNKTRPVAAFFDPRILPNPRPWLEKRLGALASLAHVFRKGEIPPMAIKGGVIADATAVRALAPRETLDQLFDRAAKHPWRSLPPEQPSPAFVCDSGESPIPCPPHRHFNMRYRTVAEREAERRNKLPDAAA
jgi:putative DNA primase/helicase